MPYNLGSRVTISDPPDTADPIGWCLRETALIENRDVRRVVQYVVGNLASFARWPEHALLLWDGCTRVPMPGQKIKYHRYLPPIKEQAKKLSVYLDARPNGPAIAAFLMAGGERPPRLGSTNRWSIHHIYSGKFDHPKGPPTIHAPKKATHFTQSAGLVALHPIADSMADEFPCFAWLLRVDAFKRFGYDPDGVFSESADGYGFAKGYSSKILDVLEANGL